MIVWVERIWCMEPYKSGVKRSSPLIVSIREPEMTSEAENNGFFRSRFVLN
ncbi:hypothetical protein Lalb_Chr05g0213841 [Lupinus albus]|uniref:Uncharacterized protein n=1 Tax=Lupinus albus TaxID=3870 RepID=A0A6A4QI34_LUPAL|nr:hypothetical protein Lalb_Chr05g0213841 [Lupinus albus]